MSGGLAISILKNQIQETVHSQMSNDRPTRSSPPLNVASFTISRKCDSRRNSVGWRFTNGKFDTAELRFVSPDAVLLSGLAPGFTALPTRNRFQSGRVPQRVRQCASIVTALACVRKKANRYGLPLLPVVSSAAEMVQKERR